MGEQTEISWTDHSFNPWWGCTRVSPGCQHCYAEAFSKRTGNDVWGKDNDRRFFGDKHWAEPIRWNARAEITARRERVFCASMADVFEDRRDLDAPRQRLWELIVATPMLDWHAPFDWPSVLHPLMRRVLPRHAFVSWCLWRYARGTPGVAVDRDKSAPIDWPTRPDPGRAER